MEIVIVAVFHSYSLSFPNIFDNIWNGLLHKFLLYISESFSEEAVIKPNSWENNIQNVQEKVELLTITDENTDEQTKDIG